MGHEWPQNAAIKKPAPVEPVTGCVGIVKEALSQRTLHCKKIPVSSGTHSTLEYSRVLGIDRPLRPVIPGLLVLHPQPADKPMILFNWCMSASTRSPTIYSNRMT
jgi:hypothetical protein